MVLGAKSKREKEELRLLSRASKSRLIKDLIDEYDDRPEESTLVGSSQKDDNIELEERLRYEEENFVRLSLSKKDLKRLKKNTTFEDEFEVFIYFVYIYIYNIFFQNIHVYIIN